MSRFSSIDSKKRRAATDQRDTKRAHKIFVFEHTIWAMATESTDATMHNPIAREIAFRRFAVFIVVIV